MTDNQYSDKGEPVQWLSPAPKNCETCSTPIESIFIDGKTKTGPWACMCPSCHTLGPGIGKLGAGYGQQYKKNKEGKWLKVGG